MALINRISRLFKADVHAVLDRIEEPELLLRQAIREMEDDLAERERKIRITTHEQSCLGARKQELDQSLAKLEDELELCFASGKNDLARTLVRRKLETQRLVQHVMERARSQETWLDEQRRRLDEHRVTLQGLRQKADIFARRPDPNPAAGVFEGLVRHFAISDDEVEVALLREQRKRQPS